MLLHPPRQLPARDEQAQLHVDVEGVFCKVGAREGHPVPIGHCALDVEDADLAVIVVPIRVPSRAESVAASERS